MISEKAQNTLKNMAKQPNLGKLYRGFPPGVFDELFKNGLITTPYGDKYIKGVGWYVAAKGRELC